MKQSKYYIPEPEELFIGYEYEFKDSRGDFNSHKFTITDFCDVLEEFVDGRIRTKFLDKEDIEGLGWKNITLAISEGLHFEKNKNRVMLEDKKIIIAIGLNVCYRGECKSINEFKKIMKYLNIK